MEEIIPITPSSGFDLAQVLFSELVAHLAKRQLVDTASLGLHLKEAANEHRDAGMDAAVANALEGLGDAFIDYAKKPG